MCGLRRGYILQVSPHSDTISPSAPLSLRLLIPLCPYLLIIPPSLVDLSPLLIFLSACTRREALKLADSTDSECVCVVQGLGSSLSACESFSFLQFKLCIPSGPRTHVHSPDSYLVHQVLYCSYMTTYTSCIYLISRSTIFGVFLFFAVTIHKTSER